MYHRASITRSDVVLGRIAEKRTIRVWFAANNTLVGIWKTKTGKTCAVGHDRTGRVVLYRAWPPEDNWTRGGNLGGMRS